MAPNSRSRGAGVGLLALIIAVVVLVIISLSKSGQSSLDSQNEELKHSGKSPRLASYCFKERSGGAEGRQSSIPPSWELVHVVVNLRHGDRTSIHSLSGHIPIPCLDSSHPLQ
jgi:hypothetical protein